jgi:drug/metabolite transporter (DMT)-like permease
MHLRGIGYAFAASLMFGLGVVLAKVLSGGIDATIVAILSLAFGGMLITTGLRLAGKHVYLSLLTLKWAEWVDIFLLSCPGTALPLLLIVVGFTRTNALEGGFILQLNGVAALIFALLLLGERIRLKQSIGTLLLLLGSTLVIFKGTQAVNWAGGGSGDLLILLGAIGLGFGFIPAKRLSQRVNTLPLTAVRLLLGACSLLPVLIFQLFMQTGSLLWRPSPTILWAFAIYIVTNFCLGYLSQQEGLRLLKAWEMAAIMQTVPLFSTTFALLLLHDTITPVQVGGGAIALVGGIIISLNSENNEQQMQATQTTGEHKEEGAGQAAAPTMDGLRPS